MRVLDRFDRRIEALDVTDHQRDAGPARRGDDLAALFDRGGDRLFHHDVDAARDAGERDVVMQMGRRRDGDGIDLEIEQFIDVGDGGAAEGAGDEFGLLAVGIGDADEFGPRQPREHPGMIAAHHADADDADTQRRPRIRFYRLHHVLTDFPWP